MAYQILGIVHKISAPENVPTKDGGTIVRRTLVLMQRRFDQNTGQEFTPNFPTFEFTNKNAAMLDGFQQGAKVKVMFDINGFKYNDKQTGEEKYSSNLRGFKIEPYVVQQPQQGYQQAPAPQPQYQQAQSPQYPQSGYAPQPQAPQTAQPPFPPQNPQQGNNGLPF